MPRHDDTIRSLVPPPAPCRAPRLLLLLIHAILLLNGCAPPSQGLNVDYGSRRGEGRTSVNGTSVLGSMFARAGYEVSSWRRLSPRLQQEEVIVWAPDTFAVPSDAEIDYLENWLSEQEGRTLVYIGRDYDAAWDYWQSVLDSNPDHPVSVRRQLARITAGHSARRSFYDEDSRDCRWFRWTIDEPPLVVRSPRGPWAQAAEGAQAAQVGQPPAEGGDATSDTDAAPAAATPQQDFHARLRARLQLPEDPAADSDWRGPLQAENLLLADGQPLAVRLRRATWGSSQLIVVANGSWLLNLPLVREGNRKLAGELIRECGDGTRVCFLESDDRGLTITQTDAQLPLMLQSFTVWPINLLVLHLLLLGLIYCFSIYPIFGTPKPLAEDRVSDFGKHIEAVGALIERNRDRTFADQQIRQYRETIVNAAPRDTGTQ